LNSCTFILLDYISFPEMDVNNFVLSGNLTFLWLQGFTSVLSFLLFQLVVYLLFFGLSNGSDLSLRFFHCKSAPWVVLALGKALNVLFFRVTVSSVVWWHLDCFIVRPACCCPYIWFIVACSFSRFSFLVLFSPGSSFRVSLFSLPSS
jgi:hypothetical protein